MKILRSGGQECFHDLPLLVSWYLTGRCNYRCSYCFIYGEGRPSPTITPFSTLEQIKTAANNVASLNRPLYMLQLIGGEPTIHPHIADIISTFHEKLGERLDSVQIVTNGSRNADFYEKISELAKVINFQLNISLHTDHVEMPHILGLMENLSKHVNFRFHLMLNPAKRERVREIYDAMCEYRKKFFFTMNIDILREPPKYDSIDSRHTPEDFEWQKSATKQFNDLAKSSDCKPPIKKVTPYTYTYSNPIIHDIYQDGKVKTVLAGNRSVELAEGLANFKDMYCIANSNVLRINADGRFHGMICQADPYIGNIFEENVFSTLQDKLIHAIKCPYKNCGCIGNHIIPKFASEEDSDNYISFAKNKQAALLYEYLAEKSLKTMYGEETVGVDDAQIVYKFNRYFTARIDFKLIAQNTTENSLEIISMSYAGAKVTRPTWLQKNGNGYMITSYIGKLKFVAKANTDGEIQTILRGLDIRDSQDNSKRIPYWIDYTKLVVNGKVIFDKLTPVWHDKPYRHNMQVKNGQEITVQVEWLPHRSDT